MAEPVMKTSGFFSICIIILVSLCVMSSLLFNILLFLAQDQQPKIDSPARLMTAWMKGSRFIGYLSLIQVIYAVSVCFFVYLVDTRTCWPSNTSWLCNTVPINHVPPGSRIYAFT